MGLSVPLAAENINRQSRCSDSSLPKTQPNIYSVASVNEVWETDTPVSERRLTAHPGGCL